MAVQGVSSSAVPTARATWVLAALGTFVALVAYTGPLGNLPTIAGALQTEQTGQTWILSSMSVGLAATLLTAGALADAHGRRRVFTVGSVGLAVGALLCAAADGTGVFLAGRVIDGAGAAALMTSSLGILAEVTPTPAQRARASGLWGASVGAGIACGPVLAGLLDQIEFWRGFYLALGLGGLSIGLAARLAVRNSVVGRPRPVDLPGTLSLGASMVLTLVALVEGRGGLTPGVIGSAAAAAVLLAVFLAIQSLRADPMLDLSLFRRPAFTAATCAAMSTGVSVIGLTSYACTYFIRGLHVSSLHASVLLVTWSGTSAAAALFARRLPAALTGTRQLAIGLVGVAVGELVMLGFLVPGLFVTGLASGILNAGLGREAVATVEPDQASLGSGVNNTARYVGSSIGVTLVAIIVVHGGPGAELAAGWRYAVLTSAVIAMASGLVVFALSLTRRSVPTSQRSDGCPIGRTRRPDGTARALRSSPSSRR